MKPIFYTIFFAILTVSVHAQSFPQPHIWLQDTAAQVINPTMEQVMEFRDKTEQQI